MKVINRLAAVVAVVDDETVAFTETQLLSNVGSPVHQYRDDWILCRNLIHRVEVDLRNDLYMRRSGGFDVIKSQDQIVLINDLGRYFAVDDFAESTMVGHGSPPGLD